MAEYRRYLLIFVVVFFSYGSFAQIRTDRYLATGMQLLSQRNYTAALETFSRIILTRDDNWEAWYYRGLTKFYLGDEGGSEIDFNKAISLQPSFAELYLYRGIIKDHNGDHYGALEDFNRGLDLKPDNPVLLYSRGTTYLQLNNFTRSIQDFDKAIEKDPRMHSAFLNRGIAKANLLKRNEAFTDFNEAIMLNPFSSEGHLRKGLLFYEIGNYNEALVSFSEVIRRDSLSTRALYARALTWDEVERPDSCLADLSRVINIDPLHSAAIYNRAIIKSKQGDLNGAINDYHLVNRLHPNHILSYFNRGLLWFQKKEYQGALADLSEAIRLYPDFAKAYLARASVYNAIGKNGEAQKDQMTANEKISSNIGSTRDDLALNYADTTIQFDELISLNSKFMRSFSTLAEGSEAEKFNPLGFMLMNDSAEIISEVFEKEIDSRRINLYQEYPEFDPETIEKFFSPKKFIDLASEKKFNEAIERLDLLIGQDQNNGPALFLRAIIKFDMIRFVMSTGLLDDVAPISLDGEALQETRTFTQTVDYSDVLEDYSLLIVGYPNLAAAWYNRGLIKLYSRDYSGAEKDFTKALEIDSRFAEAWFNRGIVRFYAAENNIRILGGRSEGCLDFSKAGELGIAKSYEIIKDICGNN